MSDPFVARETPEHHAPPALLVFGGGYTGLAVARLAVVRGIAVTVATRQPEMLRIPDVGAVAFEQAATRFAAITHVLSTVPPSAEGDPVLRRHEAALRAAPHLRWIGYFSTTGIYGDRKGGWVDETTPPDPRSERARRRIAAEAAWTALAQQSARGRIDLMRLAGIYGPGRSPFAALRAGTARRVLAPGHLFGRIHRDDIAEATLAAMRQDGVGRRVLNFSDDGPAESAEVTAYAAGLIAAVVPEGVPLHDAWPGMSAMARSFWQDDRKVASRLTQQWLGRRWRYPDYRSGLAATLAEEQEAVP